MSPRRAAIAFTFAVALASAASCVTASIQHARYTPHVRELTITTLPILTKEIAAVYPFVKEDMAKGGVLEGKEVYAFEPSTLTVFEGDTISLTLINPEDDVHGFVLPDLAVGLKPQSVTHATYVAKKADLYLFKCSQSTHLPSMYGTLVVLPAP
jgi:plastocyanin